MSTRHPKRRRLQRWLDTGEPRRVSRHIERCPQCQEQLEDLSALDEELVADLQAATDPPADLRARTYGGVDVRLHDEAVFGAFIDLFAIGWEFTRVVLDPELTDRGGAHHGSNPADGSDGGGA